MTTRLVTVPANLNMVIVREEYLAITNGNAAAAALLNWFERWRTWRADKGISDEWQYLKNQKDFRKALLGIFSEGAIKTALKLLRDCGFIKTGKASGHSYDQRLKYALVIDRVQAALDAVFSTNASGENDQCIGQIQPMDRSNSTNASVADSQSTLDQESLDQKSFKQESSDQRSAAGTDDAAAAARSTTLTAESDFLKIFRQTAARLGGNGSPPSSARPPLTGAAVAAFAANIQRDGKPVPEAVQAAIKLACEKYGVEVVISKIQIAGTRAAQKWAYVERMLRDVDTSAKHEAVTQTDEDPLALWEAQRAQRAADRAAMSPEMVIWSDTRDQLEQQLDRPTFETWLKDARLIRCDDGVYVIGVGNVYARDMLDVRLRRSIERTLREFAGQNATIRVEVEAVQSEL